MHFNAHLDVDAVALENEDTVTVMLELEAPAAPATGEPRPEHTAVVVLDRSGSMAGPRLEHAKQALVALVDRLDDRDRFGLVVFDHQAAVAIPAGKVADLGRDRLRRDIAAVAPGGMTDLSSGYLRGLQEARRASTDTGATVLLLSDGHANSGETDPEKLAGVARAAGQQAVTTSTIGIGTGYDESILTAVASGGVGNHSFAEHADAAAAAVAMELDGLLSKTVQAANLLIAPSGQVESVALLNDGLSAQVVEGGVLAELGDFYSGEKRRVTIKISVPAMAALGLAQVARLELGYVELPGMTQHTVTIPVSVNVVPLDVAQGRVPNPTVQREVLFLEAQQAKKEAEAQLSAGDFAAADGTLAAATAAIVGAPPELMDDDLRAEADWLTQSRRLMADRDRQYTSKRFSADRARKSRGYKSRRQGGEIPRDSDDPWL